MRSFSYFSAQGSEKGGEAEPTQKATLFPSGSALHPTMNGVLKNITLGTRLFFIPHNWAICPRVSSGLLVQSANETALVLERCAGVKIPTSQLDAQWLLCEPLALCAAPPETKQQPRENVVVALVSETLPQRPLSDSMLNSSSHVEDDSMCTLQWLNIFNTISTSPPVPPPALSNSSCLLLSKETRGAPVVSSGA